jgi:hypothetical protein
MTKLLLRAQDFRNLESVSGDETVTVSVCGKDYSILGSKVPFISSHLLDYF